MLSAIYRRLAARRRARLAGSARQQRLHRPVISVGNLAVGGRGKTPVVATVAQLLLAAGERPAILSRGYGRTDPRRSPVVVSDGHEIRADLPRAGDEPLMLARRVPGVVVVVAADRHAAGDIAERQLGATVHVLDDGFQHLRLARDLDLVLVSGADLAVGARTLPGGWLREGLDALGMADAVLLAGARPEQLPAALGAAVFWLRPVAGDLQPVGGSLPPPGRPVVALAGIAGPERFFADLREAGWPVVATRSFRDHHPYTAADLRRLWDDVRRHGAAGVVTTEKDAVRLLPFRPFPVPVAWRPLTMEIEPAAAFRRWLLDALRAVPDTIVD